MVGRTTQRCLPEHGRLPRHHGRRRWLGLGRPLLFERSHPRQNARFSARRKIRLCRPAPGRALARRQHHGRKHRIGPVVSHPGNPRGRCSPRRHLRPGNRHPDPASRRPGCLAGGNRAGLHVVRSAQAKPHHGNRYRHAIPDGATERPAAGRGSSLRGGQGHPGRIALCVRPARRGRRSGGILADARSSEWNLGVAIFWRWLVSWTNEGRNRV
mmetsp:Transcript_5631/g.13939  ORF Transcript_5631/g.13939 Transcript_5631/m.13939 type:complete len:213 (+) Transcript_5631:633-1271(+)